MAAKRYAEVNKKNCIACGTCMIVCPKDAIEIKQGYYAYAEPEACVGCAKCTKECPTGCISILQRQAADAAASTAKEVL